MSLKKIYSLLFFIGIFFFPFNEFKGISALGEFQSEAGSFFLLAGFIVLLLSGRISIPIRSIYFNLLLLFLLWCAITSVINLPTIATSYFKFTTGINRFIRQYFALMLSCIVFFVLYWNVLINMSSKEILFKIRKIFLMSLTVAAVYGFLEAMVVIFHISQAYALLNLFSYLPFLEVDIDPNATRISSIAAEPPFLAIYLITITGWMFSYIITESKITKFIPLVVVLLLTYFSGSRTALLVVTLQIVICFSFLYKSKQYKKYIIYASVFIAFFTVILLAVNANKVITSVQTKLESLNFSDNLTKTNSNKSRFGLQYASIQVYKENPVVGVGFGQQTYHSRHHYPRWATKDNYEFTDHYKNIYEKSFPPGYNIYTRLLAETGTIGILLFLALLISVLIQSRRLLRITVNEEHTLALILYISFIGLIINWMQFDSFRIYGFWLCLALLIKLTAATKVKANE